MGGNFRSRFLRQAVPINVRDPLRSLRQNLITYRIEIGSHVMVLEPDYLKTESAQLN